MRKKAGVRNDVLAADFVDFIVLLNQHRVHYALVGGYALAVHGVVRATGDIDFLYRRTESNVSRLCDALQEFGAPPVVVDESALLKAETVSQFGTPPYRIDLLSSIDGVTFTQVWKGSSITIVDGQEVRVIGANELRKNKSATGRKKDADDVRQLATLDKRRKR